MRSFRCGQGGWRREILLRILRTARLIDCRRYFLLFSQFRKSFLSNQNRLQPQPGARVREKSEVGEVGTKICVGAKPAQKYVCQRSEHEAICASEASTKMEVRAKRAQSFVCERRSRSTREDQRPATPQASPTDTNDSTQHVASTSKTLKKIRSKGSSQPSYRSLRSKII